MALKGLVVFLLVVIVALVLAILRDKGFIVFQSGLDLSSLLLSAATLIVTGVGVLAGLLAIFGYSQIKESALHEARTHARTVATEVASSVAARVARDVPRSDTTDQQAVDIVNALDNGDPE